MSESNTFLDGLDSSLACDLPAGIGPLLRQLPPIRDDFKRFDVRIDGGGTVTFHVKREALEAVAGSSEPSTTRIMLDHWERIEALCRGKYDPLLTPADGWVLNASDVPANDQADVPPKGSGHRRQQVAMIETHIGEQNWDEELDNAVEAWWASNPHWKPISEYRGGKVLFRTPAPAHLFYGKREGDAFIQLQDNECVDESLENPWDGPAPIEFVEVPLEVAIVYMMQ